MDGKNKDSNETQSLGPDEQVPGSDTNPPEPENPQDTSSPIEVVNLEDDADLDLSPDKSIHPLEGRCDVSNRQVGISSPPREREANVDSCEPIDLSPRKRLKLENDEPVGGRNNSNISIPIHYNFRRTNEACDSVQVGKKMSAHNLTDTVQRDSPNTLHYAEIDRMENFADLYIDESADDPPAENIDVPRIEADVDVIPADGSASEEESRDLPYGIHITCTISCKGEIHVVGCGTSKNIIHSTADQRQEEAETAEANEGEIHVSSGTSDNIIHITTAEQFQEEDNTAESNESDIQIIGTRENIIHRTTAVQRQDEASTAESNESEIQIVGSVASKHIHRTTAEQRQEKVKTTEANTLRALLTTKEPIEEEYKTFTRKSIEKQYETTESTGKEYETTKSIGKEHETTNTKPFGREYGTITESIATESTTTTESVRKNSETPTAQSKVKETEKAITESKAEESEFTTKSKAGETKITRKSYQEEVKITKHLKVVDITKDLNVSDTDIKETKPGVTVPTTKSKVDAKCCFVITTTGITSEKAKRCFVITTPSNTEAKTLSIAPSEERVEAPTDTSVDLSTPSNTEAQITSMAPSKEGIKATVETIADSTYVSDSEDNDSLEPGKKGYKCNICGKAFPLLNILQCHRLVHQSEPPPASGSGIQDTEMQEDEEESPEVVACGSQVKDFARFILEEGRAREAQTRKRSFVCPVCGKGFFQKSALSNHLRVHQEKEFRCEVCKRPFRYQVSLERHVCELLVCNKCGFRTLNTVDYEKHHCYQFQCLKCLIRYKTQVTLDAHACKGHPPRTFKHTPET